MVGTSLIIILFMIMGLYLSTGRGSWLIAGFNMLPQEDKEKYDTEALCKYMGKMMFAYAFSMVLLLLGEIYNITWFIPFSVVIIVGLTISILVYVNTGGRFKK